jgi:hypothetical protein
MFFLTLGVGLAPLLGKVGVPQFRPLATLIPLNLEEGVFVAAAFLLALPTVGVQFFAKRRLRMLFWIVFTVAVVLTLALLFTYSFFVEKIELEGGTFSARYIVGDTMLPTCPCVRENKPVSTCIGTAMTTNPAEVSACYPRSEIAGRAAVLSLVYVLAMFAYGLLIGLVLRVGEGSARPRSSPDAA